MYVVGNVDRQETGCCLNNRAENSHWSFRRRERAMTKFGRAKSFQKFVSIHASVHNHFNKDRHLERRKDLKKYRTEAMQEWRQLVA